MLQSADFALTDVFDAGVFNAPVQGGAIDGLVGEYEHRRREIESVATLFQKQYHSLVRFFIDGNCRDGGSSSYMAERIFRKEGAIASLNSHFWSRAMKMTDVLECMPAARRNTWAEAIQTNTTPDFDETTVRSTFEDLLSSRPLYFAERVDGIYRALSDVHLTNSPTGFRRRMIIRYVVSEYGHIEHRQSCHIHDLRCVIARFMGADEPTNSNTYQVLEKTRRRNGDWFTLDGGALRVRTYAVGTAHLEVHEDMAWRLNAVLASLYPAAIAKASRTPPARSTRKARTYKAIERPIPAAVAAIIGYMKPAVTAVEVGNRTLHRPIPNTWNCWSDDKDLRAEAERILISIGGVRVHEGAWRFDYDAADVLDDITTSRMLPDTKTHQYYPTPSGVVDAVIKIAAIEDGMSCLEPSAGQGALAERMGANVKCVELSELHCTILRAKGLEATCADFLTMKIENLFDRVILNPPFSQGRAQAHLVAAIQHVAPGGKLVAVLPASLRGKSLLPNVVESWLAQFDGAFHGCGASVVLYSADVPKQ